MLPLVVRYPLFVVLSPPPTLSLSTSPLVSCLAIYRLTANAKPGATDKSVATRLQALYTNFISKQTGAQITGGVFLVSNGSNAVLVQLLEAPTKTLMALLRKLNTDTQTKEGEYSFLTDLRVCSLSDEVPREWPLFAFRSITLDAVEEYEAQSDVVKAVFKTLRQLLELGRELRGMGERAQAFVETSMTKKLLNGIPMVRSRSSVSSSPPPNRAG